MGFQAAAITAGGLLALFPAGIAIDRLGVRVVLLIGVAATAIGLALTAVARVPIEIYVAAALSGIGGVACRVSWSPAMMRLQDDRLRRRAFSWNAALLVGTGAGWTALAGSLPTWTAHLAFAGLSGTQLTLIGGAGVTALAAFCYWPLTLPGTDPVMNRPTMVVGSAAVTQVTPLLTAVTFWMVAAALVLPFFNVYFRDRFGMSVAGIGVMFGAVHVISALVLIVAAEAPRRWGTRPVLLCWMFAFAPTLAALGATGTLRVAIGLFFVQGLVGPATNPLIDQLLLERVPADRHGLVASWRNAGAEAAGFVGSAAGGLLLQRSFPTLFLVAATVALLSGVLVAWVASRRG